MSWFMFLSAPPGSTQALPYTWSSTEEFSHIVLIAPSFDSLYFTSPTLIMGVISTVIRYHKDNDFIKAPLMGSDMYKERCYTTQSNTLSPCDNWSCWIIATEQPKVISYLAKAVWPPPGLQLSYFFLESGLPSAQTLLRAPSYYSGL